MNGMAVLQGHVSVYEVCNLHLKFEYFVFDQYSWVRSVSRINPCSPLPYRYTAEVAISRMHRDMQLLSIGAGADEVMLSIICKLSGTLPK